MHRSHSSMRERTSALSQIFAVGSSRQSAPPEAESQRNILPKALCALCGNRYLASTNAHDAETYWRQHAASVEHQRYVKRWLGSIPEPRAPHDDDTERESAPASSLHTPLLHDDSVTSEPPIPAPPLAVTHHPRVHTDHQHTPRHRSEDTSSDQRASMSAAPPSIDRSEMPPCPLEVTTSTTPLRFATESSPLQNHGANCEAPRAQTAQRNRHVETQTDSPEALEEGVTDARHWTEQQEATMVALFQERQHTRSLLRCFIKWHRRWFVSALGNVGKPSTQAESCRSPHRHDTMEPVGPTVVIRAAPPPIQSPTSASSRTKNTLPEANVTPGRHVSSTYPESDSDSVDGLLSLLTPDTQRRAARVLGREAKGRRTCGGTSVLPRPLMGTEKNHRRTAASALDTEELRLKRIIQKILHKDLNLWRAAHRDDLYASASKVAVQALESLALIKALRNSKKTAAPRLGGGSNA